MKLLLNVGIGGRNPFFLKIFRSWSESYYSREVKFSLQQHWQGRLDQHTVNILSWEDIILLEYVAKNLETHAFTQQQDILLWMLWFSRIKVF